jgi:hypothetical protein
MERSVQTEWLDQLAADDPRAVQSRRDLERINRVMGNEGLMRRMLRSAARAKLPKRVVELGAGDGKLILRLAKSLAWTGVELVLLDRKNAVTEETRDGFAKLGWQVEIVTAEVFQWLGKPDGAAADIMFANLFVHHFSEPQLKRLLPLIAAKTNCFIACEPRRAAVPLLFSKMVGMIGCNEVTRQDAVLSVEAGFIGRELSALWPAAQRWELRECGAKLFSHTFMATRVESNPR